MPRGGFRLSSLEEPSKDFTEANNCAVGVISWSSSLAISGTQKCNMLRVAVIRWTGSRKSAASFDKRSYASAKNRYTHFFCRIQRPVG